MLESLGIKKGSDNSFYGVVSGYYVLIENQLCNNTPAYVLTINFQVDSSVGKIVDLLTELKSINENKILETKCADGLLKVSFNGLIEESLLQKLIMNIIENLKENNIVSTCVHCGKKDFLSFYKYNGGISCLCSECGSKLIDTLEQQKNAANNYLVGFAGALIGSVIGSIAWILIGLAGFYASIAGYLIAFCSFKGYKLLKGKITVVGVIINVCTILLAFLFANYIGLFFELRKSLDELTFSVFNQIMPLVIKEPGVIKELLLNLGLGLLFIVLGSYKTIQTFFQEAKNKDSAEIQKLQ